MWQFILGSGDAYAALEVRARRACVQFCDQAMPPGSNPSRATIGIEIEPASGVARLLVTRGVDYSGQNDEVRNWLLAGQRRFDSFTELRSWIDTVLRASFASSVRAAPTVPSTDVADGSKEGLDDTEGKALAIATRHISEQDDFPS